MSAIDMNRVETLLLTFQSAFCQALMAIDPTVQLQQDQWQRDTGGGGKTLALADGQVIEKAGVNFSHVWGDQLPPSASANRPEIAGTAFQAMGVSTIIHPLNPFAPTAHANIRIFAAGDPANPTWWVGGGFDLTPYYAFEQDCIEFHQHAKAACDPFGETVYPRFKQWADDYFYIHHRKEARGVGGIFFDDLNEWGFAASIDFLQGVSEHFAAAYLPILERRKDTPFTKQQQQFQRYRRGRYVEFNLVQDRGTLFGLQSGGRTESILISLPKKVEWHYQYLIQPDSAEAALTDYFLQPQDWASKTYATN